MTVDSVRVRFAPSPTGFLHLGGVRTALFNWLFARHEGGEFLLRIEDTDRSRHSEEAVQVILEGLRWLGLDWDGPEAHQADRLELYRRVADEMLAKGLAYRCSCTPERLEQMRAEQLARKEKVHYDGRCRERTDHSEGASCCVRFRLPGGDPVEYEDLVYGKIRVERSELDDLVILKTDGFPSYNFANVVDDSDMKITHVIRGDDHINNTPRQIAMYEALGLKAPKFAHLPMIVDENRKKLSKRHAAANVLKYREDGVLPEALLNYIAKLGWGFGDEEFFTREQLVEKFSLDRVNRSACAIDSEKFLWICSKHMEAASNEALGALWLERLVAGGVIDAERAKPLEGSDWLHEAVETLKVRARTISEMVEKGRFYFTPPEEYDEKGARKFLKPAMLPALEELLAGIRALGDPPAQAALETLFKQILEKHEVKMLKLAQPVRIFLTGGTASPGIFEILLLLGKDETVRRMEKGLEFMRSRE